MDAFYGEIRAFPFTFAPENWAYCNGSLLTISQYQATFAILGINFGGDGKTTFGLPNLNGQIIGGPGVTPGGTGLTFARTRGEEKVTITSNTYPTHTHTVSAFSGPANLRTAAPNTAAPLSTISLVNDGTANQKTFDANPIDPANKVVMASAILTPVQGGGQAHENRQPVLPLSWCMCVQNGAWPDRP